MAPISHFRQKRHGSTGAEGHTKTKKRKKSLKDQLRSVQRLLRQKEIPATVRVAQERILNMLQYNLKESSKKEKEKKMAKKYKMVKFFEKRKITRMYKTCLNALKSSTDGETDLESRLQVLKQELNYVTYFPKDEKYISLFPPTPYNNTETLNNQDKWMKLIKEQVETKELPDASELVLQSPKEKKSGQNGGRNKTTKILNKQDKNVNEEKGDEDEGLPNVPLVDDFFIDTKPSVEPKQESENTASSEVMTDKTGYTTLGLSDTKHKVKRLKNERDEMASKKKKKSQEIM